MTDSMSLYFRCDAGREDGLGHLSRCLVLADALDGEAQRVVFLVHSPDGVGRNAIERRGFGSRLTPAFTGMHGDLEFVLAAMAPDSEGGEPRPLLVLDSRRVDSAYASACGERAFVVCLDDEQLRDLPCDVLVNGNAWVLSDNYAARDGRILLAGPTYNLIREDFFERQGGEPTSGSPLSVLITLGGEDPGNHTVWIMEALAELLAGHRVTVVVGPAHPDPDSVELAARRSVPGASVVRDPPSMVPHITAADVAVTAGGTTCYELAAARVAQAAIAIEDHQEPLVACLASHGCLVPLGSFRKLSRERVRQTLAELLSSSAQRRRLREAAAVLFPASGAPAVAQVVRAAYRNSN